MSGGKNFTSNLLEMNWNFIYTQLKSWEVKNKNTDSPRRILNWVTVAFNFTDIIPVEEIFGLTIRRSLSHIYNYILLARHGVRGFDRMNLLYLTNVNAVCRNSFVARDYVMRRAAKIVTIPLPAKT